MFPPVSENTKLNSGFTLLPVALTVLSVMVIVGTFVLLIGYNSLRNSLLLVKSHQANSLVNACVEHALLKIQENSAFAGAGEVTLDTGACSYNVASLGGERKAVTASSIIDSAVRKAKVIVASTTPKIFISEWQEVAD
ncbi:MAG: hypothetical protein AAB847_00695 [Patescibacteria group bacterium]|mgnify:CR=1 FL=1